MTDAEVTLQSLRPDQLHDPYPVMAALRHHQRVAELMPGFYYVAKHTDPTEVFRDFRHFSKAWLPPGLLGVGDDPEREVTVQETDSPRHGPMRRLYLTAALAPAEGRRRRCAHRRDQRQPRR